MDWYYAINGQRVGPVAEGDFAELVSNGTITGETLVWRAGMPQWEPWAKVAQGAGLPGAAPGAGGPTGAGGSTPLADVSEGWSAEDFWVGLQANGFTTSVGGCFGRAWGVYKAAFGACLGVTLLGYLLLMVAGFLPIIGLLSIFFATPQITAGLYWYFLGQSRGESPGVNALFEGYRRCFGGLALLGLAQLGISIVMILPIGVLAAILGASTEGGGADPSTAMLAVVVPLMVILVLVAVAVLYRFMLAHVIMIDMGVGVGEALKLSWRVMGKRFWTMVGLAIILLFLVLAGTLALLVGLLLVMPMYPAIYAQVYEDARLSAMGQPPME